MAEVIRKPSTPRYIPTGLKKFSYEVLNIVPPKVEFMVMKDQQHLTRMVTSYCMDESDEGAMTVGNIVSAIEKAIRADLKRLDLLAALRGTLYSVEITDAPDAG